MRSVGQLAIVITASIIARAFCVDIHTEEAERRWQILRTKTKEIHIRMQKGKRRSI